MTAISFQYVKLLESTYIYDKVNCDELYYCKLLFGLFPNIILSFLFLRSKLAWREREVIDRHIQLISINVCTLL